MWRKFRKHRLAMLGGTVTILIYLTVIFAEFLAPFRSVAFSSEYTYAPPQPLHIFDRTEEGLRISPYVSGYKVEVDPVALRRTFVVDPEQKIPVGFFVHGAPYRMLGFIETDIHLIGPKEYSGDPNRITIPMYLFGADRIGRDVFSRIIYGTRISMTIGLVGVALSFLLGITLGGLSGFYGGWVDNLIQRTDRIAALDSDDPAVDGPGRGAALLMDAAPGLLRHHDPVIAHRLDGLGTRGARAFSLVAHRGFRHVCTPGRQQQDAHHPCPHGALLCQPHHRFDHPGDPGHDFGGNSPQFPGAGPASAHRQLGRAPPGSAKHPLRLDRALAAPARRGRHHRRAGTQLPG